MFNQFVKVTYNYGSTWITGFSIEVFEAAVKKLPYDLQYELVPFNGSYDEMLAQVHNKVVRPLFSPVSIFFKSVAIELGCSSR